MGKRDPESEMRAGTKHEQQERRPFERPKLEKLGKLSRVVKQSGAITVSGGRA